MPITALLSQMLPILVYIIVDSIINKPVFSILAAIIFAIGQFFVSYIQTKAIDYFIIVDLVLIVALGLITILLDNEIFFKIKPALIEGIVVIFLLTLLFMKDSFLISYFNHYMPKGYSINPLAISYLKKILVVFVIYNIFHILSVIYTAFYCSKKTWAIISGPGYFFLFIPVMLFIFLKNYLLKKETLNKNKNELKYNYKFKER